MSKKVSVVTDSTANLPQELVEQYGILVIPLLVNWGLQTYRDGVDMGAAEFFARLKTDPVHPTTAAPSLGETREVYARAAAEATEGVVGIHISLYLSGTYAVALKAKEMLADRRIAVFDSRFTSLAQGFLVLAAARAAAEGKSFDEVVRTVEAAMPRVGVAFTVETLEYLRRGGRIGGAAAFLGGVLDLKPVLEMRGGRIEPVERVRSKKKALERIVARLVEKTEGARRLRLGAVHAAAPEDAAEVLRTAQERFEVVETLVGDLSPILGAHTGPGTVGLAYCLEQ